ncbi:MAG: non-ribosomal peptide synthetase, partial [bacterium]|nr:non-ribosomal peptide synthetase [bacterium]
IPMTTEPVNATGMVRGEYLRAYIVSTKPYNASQLRESLSALFPGDNSHMLPAHFVRLERMPLTPEGEINREILAALEVTAEPGREYEPPADEVEEKLVDVWAEVLAVDKNGISTTGDFFEMGGHSLKAIILISKIHRLMDVKLPLEVLFETHTIKGMAEHIKKTASRPGDRYHSIKPVEKKEYYVLSSSQKRMYIVQKMDAQSKSYNMPFVTALEGELDKERLSMAFEKLIRRHESLRTSFLMLKEGPVQRVHEPGDVPFDLEYYEAPGNKALEKEIVTHFIKPFDLSKAPLLRVGLINTGQRENVLMVDMYHIISDGFSFGILVSDFSAFYNGDHLPPLRIQYKDFSQWRHRMIVSGDMKKQEDYWLERLSGDIPPLKLPVDYPRPDVRDIDRGDSIVFRLEEELSEKIYHLVKETQTTLFILLLAVYKVLLFKYTGQEDIIVGSPITGRSHADLEQVIGVFLNMLAIRNRPRKRQVFRDFLMEVKENALGAFENQDYPFDTLVRKLKLQGETGRNPLFDTEFAIHNMDGPKRKEFTGLKVKSYPGGTNFAKFDLHF